jgi:uncharacterized protein (TIGR02996 family)
MSRGVPKAILDYIVANIDDDTPRLAYADWLDENGQADRAEFVRVQVERARLPEWDATQVRLRLREKKLLDQHGERWLAEIPAPAGAKWEGFRRGIVAEVSFASYDAMRQSAHACRAVAPVEAVTVRWPRKREPQENAPPIAELRELSLTGRPESPNDVVRLAESPQLRTLRVLTARGLWADVFPRLVRSLYLAPLKALRLPNSELGNAGILALLESSALTQLEELDLSGRGVMERYNEDPVVRAPGLVLLAGWEGLKSVRSLNLNGNDLGRSGLRALLQSRHVGGLKELSLRNTRLDGQAMAEFDDARKGLQLEVLDLGENLLKDLGAEYVALVPCLKELKALRLDRCEITQLGARLFAKKATFLGGLRRLDVSHNHFAPDGLKALLERKSRSLHTLQLRDNDLHDEDAESLAGSAASNALLEVDLSQNDLGSDAAQALAESKHLRELLVLRLGDNPIPKSAAATLAASPLGRRLAVLELDDRPGPPAGGRSGEGDIPF